MHREFAVADKVVNGETLTRFNTELGAPEVMKWEVEECDIPKLGNGKSVIIKAAEMVTVPSIWKGFLGIVNSGFNDVTNKLNRLLGNNNCAERVDYSAPFKSVGIHTGVKVDIPDDEVLVLYTLTNDNTGIQLSGGCQMVDHKGEIIVQVYNVYPTDKVVEKGQPIAVGVFQKIARGENGEQPFVSGAPFTGGINLDK